MMVGLDIEKLEYLQEIGMIFQ